MPNDFTKISGSMQLESEEGKRLTGIATARPLVYTPISAYFYLALTTRGCNPLLKSLLPLEEDLDEGVFRR